MIFFENKFFLEFKLGEYIYYNMCVEFERCYVLILEIVRVGGGFNYRK